MGVRLRVMLGLLILALGGVAHLSGQTAEVSVRGVEFQRVRDAGGDEWWEASVELAVEGRGGGAGRFADRVRVGLNLAFQRPAEGRPLEFYRAAVTAPTLEAGRRQFRFYLPPALVRRDRITGDARFWTVDLRVGGQLIEPTSEHVSPAFSSAAALSNFRDQHARLSPANDGILIPRHASPWATDRVDPDPVVLRPDAAGGER